MDKTSVDQALATGLVSLHLAHDSGIRLVCCNKSIIKYVRDKSLKTRHLIQSNSVAYFIIFKYLFDLYLQSYGNIIKCFDLLFRHSKKHVHKNVLVFKWHAI